MMLSNRKERRSRSVESACNNNRMYERVNVVWGSETRESWRVEPEKAPGKEFAAKRGEGALV